MKKTLLSCAMLSAFALTATAQLYDQTSGKGTLGMISATMTDASSTVKSADDFTVPAAGWMVSGISVAGFRSASEGKPMTKVTVEFYADSLGPIGDPIYSEVITLDNGGVPTPTIDTLLTIRIQDTWLTEGTYWLSVYGDSPSASRWNWYTQTTATIGQEAMLIDVDDYFSIGATDWTTFTDLGSTQTGLIFQIHDAGSMVGIAELNETKISIFPIPATDVLNVVSETAKVERLNIYDATGKLVMSELNPSSQLDVSNFATGIYIAEVSTTDGIAKKQFVKK
ncbi:MAG: hypothetical protein ACI8ZO_001113 [Flavobacteriales bacterium]|jgi:hypothetical protein